MKPQELRLYHHLYNLPHAFARSSKSTLRKPLRSATYVVEVGSVFAVELVEGQLVIILKKHTGGKCNSPECVCVCLCVQSGIYLMVCADLC